MKKYDVILHRSNKITTNTIPSIKEYNLNWNSKKRVVEKNYILKIDSTFNKKPCININNISYRFKSINFINGITPMKKLDK